MTVHDVDAIRLIIIILYSLYVVRKYYYSYPIICSLEITNYPTAPITKYLTRAIRAINITELCHDILSSRLITHPPSTLSDLVDCYNSTLSQLLNKHAPLKSKIIRIKPRNPYSGSKKT